MQIIKNKLIIIMLITIILLQNTLTISFAATEISSAKLINDHAIESHIKFEKNGVWVDVRSNYICYVNNSEKYPAYCISHGLNGVDEEGNYTVNISKLLNNEKVWRTIVNGYPYVTASSLGVESNDDAYVATKQAVFSVMLNRDVKSFYKAKNERGKKIIDAIYKISEKGKNGTQKYKSANINMKQIGNINKLNENFYYIQYELNSDINLGEYKINKLTNLPEGFYITDLNNNKTSTFTSNENFRLVIPKEYLDKDLTGKISIESKCKTYPIFYGEAPNSNIQDYAVTYNAYENFEDEFDINIKTNKSKIKIIKKDEETDKPIEGIKFDLIKDNIVIETKKTDINGIIQFNNLYQGNYMLKEVDS